MSVTKGSLLEGGKQIDPFTARALRMKLPAWMDAAVTEIESATLRIIHASEIDWDGDGTDFARMQETIRLTAESVAAEQREHPIEIPHVEVGMSVPRERKRIIAKIWLRTPELAPDDVVAAVVADYNRRIVWADDEPAEPTKGETLVRAGFNPSNLDEVGNVKQLAAVFIDELIKADRDFDARLGGAGSEAAVAERKRCVSIALRKAEEASMWAVKGLTVQGNY